MEFRKFSGRLHLASEDCEILYNTETYVNEGNQKWCNLPNSINFQINAI